MMPGAAEDPMAQMGMSALDQLMPKSPNPTAAIQRIEQAVDMAHQLIMSIIPQIMQWNPDVAKDAHAAARMLLQIRSTVRKEVAPEAPPDLSAGMGVAGSPATPMGPSMSGGLGMGGM
jgi:hypothetical protein